MEEFRRFVRPTGTFKLVCTFFLGLLLVLPHSDAKEKHAYKKQVEQHRIVITRTIEDRKAVAKIAPTLGATILAHGEHFLVVRPKEEGMPPQFLNRLKNHPLVLEFRQDSIVYPRKHTKRNLSTRTKQPGNKQKACQLFPRCQGANPQWAPLQIGADLAEKEIEKVITTSGIVKHAKIAVVDSGFDFRNHKDSFKVLPKIKKGHKSAGDPNIDPDGHGTAVAGVIAGKTVGVTRHLNLTIYRVTETHGDGKTSEALLAAAIEKACETHDVVNVSWGNLAEELGFRKWEDSLWYKKAVKKGCLIIKASGNSGFKSKRKSNPLQSPILLVAASGQFLNDAPFSTAGGIFGPGHGVYSTLSHQHDYSKNTRRFSCTLKGGRVGPVNGTSFAAPLVSGVAAQVITVLKTRGVLPKNPKKKIAMIKAILLASSEWMKKSNARTPVVNALFATLIASQINAATKLDPRSLISLVQSNKAYKSQCEQQAKDCTQLRQCKAAQECVSSLRFQYIACLPPPKGIHVPTTVVPHLLSALDKYEEKELVVSLLDRIPKNSALSKKAIHLISKQWNSLLNEDGKSIYSAQFGRAINLLTSVLRTGTQEDFLLPQKLRQLQRSYGTFDFLSPIGEAKQDRAKEISASKFLVAFTKMPLKEQKKFLAELPNLNPRVLNDLSLLYFFHHHRKTLPKEINRLVNDRLRELGRDFIKGKLDLIGPLVGNRPHIFDPLLQKIPEQHKALLDSLLKKPLSHKTLPLYFYVVGSQVFLGKDKLPVLEKLLKKKELRSGQFVFLIRNILSEILASKDKKAIRRSVREALLNLPFAQFFPSEIPKETLKLIGSDTFFRKFITLNLQRSIRQYQGKMIRDHTTIGAGIGNVADSLLSDHSYMNDKTRKALLKGPIGKYFSQYINLMVAEWVKYKKSYKEELAPHVLIYNAIEWLPKLLDKTEIFKKAAFLDPLRKSFIPIRDDMRIRPEKYPQPFRIAIAKLYGLPEKSVFPKMSSRNK